MKKASFFISGFFIILLLLGATRPVSASLFDDVISGIKDFFTPDAPQTLTFTSDVKHASTGDINQDGQIDAGEIVTFQFTVNNQTQNTYTFATLKTNVVKDQLNFIHDVKGAASIEEKDGRVVIPYLTLIPGQTLTISFNARINYFTEQDVELSVEPELVDKDNQSLFKGERRVQSVKKIAKEQIPTNLLQKTH